MRKTHSNSQREGGKSAAHTWGAAGAPARLRPEGEKLQRAGGRGPDGVPNGSRPLASTPSVPGKPHAAECYQHQHAAFTSNFRLNNIRRSMSWSHWLPGKCLTAAMGLHHRAADTDRFRHSRTFYQTMLHRSFSSFVVWV